MNPVKEIAGILLGKQGRGTLKAHMAQGTMATFALKVVNHPRFRDEPPLSGLKSRGDGTKARPKKGVAR